MSFLSNKKIAAVAIALVVVLILGTAGAALAAPVIKVISVFSNGKLLSMTDAPIMVKDRVYVPIRAMSEILGKNVDWDAPAYAVRVSDKPDAATDAKVKELENKITQLNAQLSERDIQYTVLKAQYDALEEKGKTVSLKDMAKQLNKDFSDYRSVEFEITLSGKESDIDVEIAVDLDDYKSEWKSLTDSRKTSYLQGIVDALLKQYEKADIEGYIYDSSTKSKPKLLTFTVSSKGVVQMKSSADLSDLEEELDDEYYRYFSDIRLSIELDGDSSDIEYYIYVNLRDYEDEWDALSDSIVKKLMSYIYEDIEYEYQDATISGSVIDSYYGDELASYSRTTAGKERFSRY